MEGGSGDGSLVQGRRRRGREQEGVEIVDLTLLEDEEYKEKKKRQKESIVDLTVDVDDGGHQSIVDLDGGQQSIVDLTVDVQPDGNLMGNFECSKAVLELIKRKEMVQSWAEVRHPRDPVQVELPECLHPLLQEALLVHGKQALYSHQVEAFLKWQQGKNLVLSTPTGSGKTLAMMLPVFQSLLENPKSTVLSLYPLRALADDQTEKFNSFLGDFVKCGGAPIPIKRFMGGDHIRDVFSEQPLPRIVLATPDMIHLTMRSVLRTLGMRDFFANLSVIVMDESHTYNGVLGHNMQLLLVRVKNIVSACHGDPSRLRFILLSATIGNPVDLARQLCCVPEASVENICESGSRQWRQTCVVTQAPGTKLEGHIVPEAIDLALVWLRLLQQHHVRSLVFLDDVKRINLWVDDLSAAQLTARAYYRSMKQSEKESVLQSREPGQIVVSTSSLEAGVDFADMGAVIIVGCHSQMSLLQRVGRSGRNQPSLVVYIPSRENIFDVDLRGSAERLFARKPEQIVFACLPDLIVRHLRLACVESNRFVSRIVLPPEWSNVVETMMSDGEFVESGNHLIPGLQEKSNDGAVSKIAFRGSFRDGVVVKDGHDIVVEEGLSVDQAFWRAFPGAYFQSWVDGKLRHFTVTEICVTREVVLGESFARVAPLAGRLAKDDPRRYRQPAIQREVAFTGQRHMQTLDLFTVGFPLGKLSLT